MSAILTPALALRYLRELSTDVRAALVLDADGHRLAGDAGIEAPARTLLAAVSAPVDTPADASAPMHPHIALDIAVPTPDGAALVVGDQAGALVVVAGPHALVGLLRHDLRTILHDLRGAAEALAGSAQTPPATHEAAVESRFRAPAEALIRAAAAISRDRAEG